MESQAASCLPAECPCSCGWSILPAAQGRQKKGGQDRETWREKHVGTILLLCLESEQVVSSTQTVSCSKGKRLSRPEFVTRKYDRSKGCYSWTSLMCQSVLPLYSSQADHVQVLEDSRALLGDSAFRNQHGEESSAEATFWTPLGYWLCSKWIFVRLTHWDSGIYLSQHPAAYHS